MPDFRADSLLTPDTARRRLFTALIARLMPPPVCVSRNDTRAQALHGGEACRPRGGPSALRAVALLVCLSLPAFSPPASAWPEASSWKAVIADQPAVPPRLIAVDKLRQQLYVFERRSPFGPSQLYACTTGQVIGDKRVQGDLKTPEGIYFVVQHIRSGLDFSMYGNEAYTLNYPNPVDRLRRKTGYGIWIHGRGEGIYPLQTQGCVALNNPDLSRLGRLLTPGTPVALTATFAHPAAAPEKDAATARVLEKKVQAWAKAWSSRSGAFFDFYDKESYTLAQAEPFSVFQSQKERLFKHLPWIRISVEDIQVLQGPGYWVTWFSQDYQAPNLSTRGVRRLYWTQNAKGDFSIVGMEWAPGMSTGGTLLASAEPAIPPLEANPKSEEQAIPLPEAKQSLDNVSLASAKPQAAPEPAALPAEEKTGPASPAVSTSPASAATAPSPVPAVPAAPAAPGGSSSPASFQASAPLDHVENPAYGKMAAPPQAAALMARAEIPPVREGALPASAAAPSPAPALTPGLSLPPALPSQRLAGASAAGRASPEDAAVAAPAPLSPAIPAAATSAAPSVALPIPVQAPVPAVAPEVPATVTPATASAPAAPAMPAAVAASARPAASLVAAEFPVPATVTPATASAPAAPASSSVRPPKDEALPAAAAPQAPTGVSEPSAKAGAPAVRAAPQTSERTSPETLPDGSPDIPVGDARNALAADLERAVLQDKKTGRAPQTALMPGTKETQIAAAVEAWRADWEKGDLDAYMRHYAERAAQGQRAGAKDIRRQKERLWAHALPSAVVLSDIRVKAEADTARVEMIQEYTDSRGGGDKGLKVLTLTRTGDVWRITNETWRPLPQ